MSGFSAAWLELREPADRRARHDFFAAPAAWPGPPPSEVVDLACGTGASFRYLAPRLAHAQRWTCIDHDRGLLERFAARLAPRHAQPRDITAEPHSARFGVRRATLELRCCDLAGGLASLALTPRALISASALLDLVSGEWIESVAAHCAQARSAALFALSYDGRIRCTPEDRFDAELRGRLNAHQRRDKGFGPALGPTATHVATTAFEAVGHRVVAADSAWQLGPDDAQLARELIDGWVAAAREIDDRPELDAWHARRLAEAASGRLEILVGHVDLLALPPR